MPPRRREPALIRRAQTPTDFPHASVKMCDVPAASIVATIRDTVSCSWIFYSNSNQSTSQTAGDVSGSSLPSAGVPGSQPTNTTSDPNLDSMHMMLDPHLRPLTPDLTDETSKQIFEEHKQLAQEYLKVQTELAYLSRHKTELENQTDDKVLMQKREVMQLEDEKESLIKLYWNLKKQLDLMEGDSWVLLPDEAPHE